MICNDCGPLPKDHRAMWTEDLMGALMPALGRNWFPWADSLIDRLFLAAKLVTLDPNPPRDKISLRTTVFWDEAEKEGIKLWAVKTPYCYNNTFFMEVNGKRWSFEGLPLAGHALKNTHDIDDKWAVKKVLKEAGLPIAEGRAFWWFAWEEALAYGEKLGFPVIVKPRNGSMSQHITPNIQTREKLIEGIRRANDYSPRFIVERFIPNAKIYRVTTIDSECTAAVLRTPAHVIGDGVHTVEELVARKNAEPGRGNPKAKDTTCYKLVINETSHRLLAEQNLSPTAIPEAGRRVFTQDKVILDLGADLHEATSEIHPDNREIFEKAARLFPTGVLGIDFLCEDISRSYKEQPCAIIELNSLPYIDMHHFPTTGAPVNVGKRIVTMVKKYYR